MLDILMQQCMFLMDIYWKLFVKVANIMPQLLLLSEPELFIKKMPPIYSPPVRGKTAKP